MDYAHILQRIHRDIAPLLGQGRVADYIPELEQGARHAFRHGAGVCRWRPQPLRGRRFAVPFSIQSISKLFACTLAFQLLGEDLWQRVGREPSGNAFNSLVQLEYTSKASRATPLYQRRRAGGDGRTVQPLRPGGDRAGAVHPPPQQ
ncbi:glutaminase [Cupriavidus basilensis]